MKILFIGDSITNGKLGESYVEIIKKLNPSWHIQNLGEDGDTLNRIVDRLVAYLKKDNSFDCIVLQGGYNDVLLPSFRDKGRLFGFAYQQQLKKGCKPLTVDNAETYNALVQHVKEIKHLFSGSIILAPLGCIGENLNSNINRQRSHLNGILEKLAVNENIAIANTHKMFDAVLQNKVQSNYCLDNFWAVTFLDRYTNLLSSKRKLHLTIDGVHLNRTGAAIFADSILEIIKNNAQTLSHTKTVTLTVS